MTELSHVDERRTVRMVDVGAKPEVAPPRDGAGVRARCAARPRASASSRRATRSSTAQVAGIMAAKRTSDLIPLCHPLPLSHVDVSSSRSATAASRSSPRWRRRRADRRRDGGADGRRGRRAHGLRHGEGDRQGDDDHRRRRWSRRRRSRLKAAVLTVSDRVSRGEAEDGSGDDARGASASRRLRGRAAARAGRGRRRSPRRSSSSPQGRALVLTTGGTGARAARRHAGGDAHGARARGARDLRGDPRRLDREDAARPALARRRRALLGSTLVVNLPGSPGGVPRRLRGASAGADARPRRCSPTRRPRPTTSRRERRLRPAQLARALLRAARQDRAHDLRAAVRLRRRVARRRRVCRRATICSGSRSRWSAPARLRWRSTG